MKKQMLRLIAATLIIGAATVSVISCSKTEQETANPKGMISHFSPSPEMVEPTIVKFIQRFDNYKAGYKIGGEDLKLGEAVWTLEAATNYTFQSTKDSLGNFSIDSVVYNVNVYVGNNNEYYIAETDAMQLFGNMVGFTSNQVSPTGTKLLVADMNVVSIENGQAVMELTTLTGGIGSDPCTTNSSDYWYPVMDMGKCGSYIGQGVGKDATDIIDGIINCSQANADYWTDVDVFEFIYNGFYPCAEDYCFWEGSSTDCLSPTDITYWGNQSLNLISTIQPTGKTRIRADVDWDFTGFPVVIYVHFMRYLSFGIPHSSGGGTK